MAENQTDVYSIRDGKMLEYRIQDKEGLVRSISDLYIVFYENTTDKTISGNSYVVGKLQQNSEIYMHYHWYSFVWVWNRPLNLNVIEHLNPTPIG